MNRTKNAWNRRNFIYALGGAGLAWALNPLDLFAMEDLDPRVAAIVAKSIGIDTHNHIEVPLISSELPGPSIDLSGDMTKSGLSAICMTFAVDYQQLKNPGDAIERFRNGMTGMDTALAMNNMTRSLNLKDLEMAHRQKKPTIVQSVEGGHFLEGDVKRVDEAYERGLRHLTLLHDNDASVPLGDVYTNPSRWGGLTSFGAEVIKACNRKGILIDMAHANKETLTAALKLTKKPLMISHTGLDTQLGDNPFMSKMMLPRLISKDQAKMVADTGGIIGVWTHLAATPMDYAKNIKAMADIIGIDHVCIGTDTKLTQPYRSPSSFNSGDMQQKERLTKPSENDNKKTAGRTEPEGERVGERTNLAWKAQKEGFYYLVVDALLKIGFSGDDIEKVGGKNFCRLFNAATS